MKAMDDLVLTLKRVATDCSQAKELAVVKTELKAARLNSKEWKEKEKSELLKNMSMRIRIEAEESLLAWDGKEFLFVSIIKREKNEKSSFLKQNNRLLVSLVAANNMRKRLWTRIRRLES